MRVSVCQVLDAIDELGLADVGLVAWELSLLERDVEPTCRVVRAQSYVKPAHIDAITNEQMYELSGRGRRRLRRCRLRHE